VVLHALDGYILAGLDALGFQYFREGALALLANQSVFYTSKREVSDRESSENDKKSVRKSNF